MCVCICVHQHYWNLKVGSLAYITCWFLLQVLIVLWMTKSLGGGSFGWSSLFNDYAGNGSITVSCDWNLIINCFVFLRIQFTSLIVKNTWNPHCISWHRGCHPRLWIFNDDDMVVQGCICSFINAIIIMDLEDKTPMNAKPEC